MTRKENYFKCVRFERPDHIPVNGHINAACWNHYSHDQLFDLCESHPIVFPDFKRPEAGWQPAYGCNQKAGEPYTDDWGCVWETPEDGITGTVTGHPLADWSAFDNYQPPDPEKSNGLCAVDWTAARDIFTESQKSGRLYHASLPHGHTFLRITDIRGYENTIFDMADDEPRLYRLIEMVTEFNLALVNRYMEWGVDLMCYPEDLGMQVGPMLSPPHLRKYFKPSYTRVMAPAKERGIIVQMHSDGDIRDLLPDLIDSGVQSINPQDLVNGIEWLKKNLKGKINIDLDIDRQKVTRFGTPKEIDSLIRHEVEELGSRQGGLTLGWGMYPGIPIENARAVFDAMEKYSDFYN